MHLRPKKCAYCAKIRWVILKMFFSRTTKPENLRFAQKLPYIVQIQVCTNHGPRGSGEVIMGKTISTCVDIRKICFEIFSGTTGSESSILHECFLIQYRSKLVKIMAPGVGWSRNRGNCFT
jgi:hypothetical protein